MGTYQERMERYRKYAKELASKDNTKELKRAVDEIGKADKLIIGGGAGLSASGGLNYMSHEILEKDFPGLANMGYKTLWEALWDEKRSKAQRVGMMAAEILWACYDFPIVKAYEDLLKIVANQNYFVLTSNIDKQFIKAGFAKERVFEPQCSASDFQCSLPCCQDIWDGETVCRKIVAHMDKETYACREEDYPVCPHCHAPAVQNMRGARNFIEDKVMWNRKEFEQFVKEARNCKTVFIELGAGFNTPGIIRHPFQRLTYLYQDVTLIRINGEFPAVPDKIKDKSIEITGDIGEVLEKMREIGEKGTGLF